MLNELLFYRDSIFKAVGNFLIYNFRKMPLKLYGEDIVEKQGDFKIGLDHLRHFRRVEGEDYDVGLNYLQV